MTTRSPLLTVPPVVKKGPPLTLYAPPAIEIGSAFSAEMVNGLDVSIWLKGESWTGGKLKGAGGKNIAVVAQKDPETPPTVTVTQDWPPESPPVVTWADIESPGPIAPGDTERGPPFMRYPPFTTLTLTGVAMSSNKIELDETGEKKAALVCAVNENDFGGNAKPRSIGMLEL
jgi:hypothetical protein